MTCYDAADYDVSVENHSKHFAFSQHQWLPGRHLSLPPASLLEEHLIFRGDMTTAIGFPALWIMNWSPL